MIQSNWAIFSAEFIHVTHSIPDSVAIALRTPIGIIVHTGDFKFDMTPVDGKLSDIQTLARLGSEGVLMLISDSTNAERPGQTPSERSIYDTIDHIFSEDRTKTVSLHFFFKSPSYPAVHRSGKTTSAAYCCQWTLAPEQCTYRFRVGLSSRKPGLSHRCPRRSYVQTTRGYDFKHRQPR